MTKQQKGKAKKVLENLRVEIVNTKFAGARYAVVGDFTHFPSAKDEKGKVIKEKVGMRTKKVRNRKTGTMETVEVPVYKTVVREQKVRHIVDVDGEMLTFPKTEAGLQEAKKALKVISSGKKYSPSSDMAEKLGAVMKALLGLDNGVIVSQEMAANDEALKGLSKR